MIIVYESKTGHTQRYAQMLAKATGLPLLSRRELLQKSPSSGELAEGIVFLGWMKVGRIEGLSKVQKAGYPVKAVCGSGNSPAAEPDTETVIRRNHLQGLPFFYLQGGMKPLGELKGLDKLMLSFFVSMLKKREQDEKTAEAISNILNGFDGVKEENLEPVLAWLRTKDETP